MKHFRLFLSISLFLISGFNLSISAQIVYYVSNGGSGNNWDIYSFDIGSGIETRLTTDEAIDNHPSISHFDNTMIAFSSDRDGEEFDVYYSNVNDIEGTAVRLTSNDDYPDRHPHWHPNGNLIIYTSKDRPVTVEDILATECSQPIITYETRYFEGMNIIDINNPGTVIPVDVSTAWNKTQDPDIWISENSLYVGHPSFNHQGDLLVFTAAIDGEGKNWEVYTAGFDPINKGLIPNSLNRITHGPNDGNNPIKMSGGATFSHDDQDIIFNSTRTTGGNSQIFSVPVNTRNLILDNRYRRTHHHGNDYVPEPLENGDLVITSDLGDQTLCNCDDEPGATGDLDVVLLQDYNTRTILGVEENQETLLLADEVSWFCGLKPNLSQCTFQPRIMNIETLWLEFHPFELLPPNLLEGYGPAYATNAQQMYTTGWTNIYNYLTNSDPNLMNQLYEEMTQLWTTFPGWGGGAKSTALEVWLNDTKQIRKIRHVIPSIMYESGLGESCNFSDGIEDWFFDESFDLKQNAPNPFSQFTIINYDLKNNEHVKLIVYDILGEEVATLVNKVQPQGSYSTTFYANDLPNGIYFYSLKDNSSVQIKKMILLK